ncbi:hypothetical protein [Curtobacterium aurantiacum]|uniref:OCRE domain-containing protein n=1 Tax=Curtobacterium aurantiacum TaxID=3236919 RepID=A0ABS5VAG2_9MICO|nr:hypothetical protein [Curtobacterium flaccumfaciens]MBT1545682.1 hypothetical protein [Curtobacterium flaccumfaciens pv. flaccumfaciens]MBT1586462.1 hypothetical protein [Curtobacterium flaccumfaciens pv. flaccumfaciens]MBT1675560.1 hypothetical protein [Curtobacterium flaccumfaciens pv. flaccumfaciens]
MTTTRQTPDDFGWRAEDLRSAYASDGSGPYRYAPDGSGPFSYDPDGSGPWLVGPEPRGSARRFAPRQRGSRSRRRRVGTACTAGALALVLAVGSVSVVAHTAPPQHSVQAGAVHGPGPDGA